MNYEFINTDATESWHGLIHEIWNDAETKGNTSNQVEK